jgi:hypothetical protein
MIEEIRFRAGIDGQVVLQVMELHKQNFGVDYKEVWRDAKVEDLLQVSAFTLPYKKQDFTWRDPRKEMGLE